MFRMCDDDHEISKGGRRGHTYGEGRRIDNKLADDVSLMDNVLVVEVLADTAPETSCNPVVTGGRGSGNTLLETSSVTITTGHVVGTTLTLE